MSILIFGIIILLFLFYLFWTWNSTKSFEGNYKRILYIIIGTLIITITTYILFIISKNGITYPHKDMIEKIRNIILLTFVPINGFITLPQIATVIGKIKSENITGKQLEKRLVIFIIVVTILILFECYYFKGIQNRIINIINLM